MRKTMVAKKKIKLEQIGSTIGRTKDQEATLLGLGLKKRHGKSEIEDSPSVRGMIKKVQHLVKVID